MPTLIPDKQPPVSNAIATRVFDSDRACRGRCGVGVTGAMAILRSKERYQDDESYTEGQPWNALK